MNRFLASVAGALSIGLAASRLVIAAAAGTSVGNLATQAPTFAAQGSKVVFNGDREGQDAPDEIYAMNADGTGETRRLTPLTHTCNAISPRWSPNGQQVAFHCSVPNSRASDIYLTDGTELTQLTHMTDAGLGAAFATWSPDGTQIAFGSTIGPPHIFIINVDGSGLTPPLTAGGRPDWSPDGRRIAFNSNREGLLEVYVMDLNGMADPVRLTDLSAVNQNARWSPNGQSITFESTRTGFREIFTMKADGSDQLQLTSFRGLNASPSWSPDGQWIVFNRQLCDPAPQNAPNGSDLFAVAADGSQEIQLTNGACAGGRFGPLSTFSAFASWGPGNVSSTPSNPVR